MGNNTCHITIQNRIVDINDRRNSELSNLSDNSNSNSTLHTPISRLRGERRRSDSGCEDNHKQDGNLTIEERKLSVPDYNKYKLSEMSIQNFVELQEYTLDSLRRNSSPVVKVTDDDEN